MLNTQEKNTKSSLLCMHISVGFLQPLQIPEHNYYFSFTLNPPEQKMEPQAVFQLTESFFSFQKEGSSKSAA
jgi:hypothetical protein